MCFSAHEQHSVQACGKKKRNAACPQVEVALLRGSADSCTAGAGSIALWVFSLLAWERMLGTRYNRVVKWQSRKHQCFAGEG